MMALASAGSQRCLPSPGPAGQPLPEEGGGKPFKDSASPLPEGEGPGGEGARPGGGTPYDAGSDCRPVCCARKPAPDSGRRNERP